MGYFVRVTQMLRNGKVWLFDSPFFDDLYDADQWLRKYSTEGTDCFFMIMCKASDGHVYNVQIDEEY